MNEPVQQSEELDLFSKEGTRSFYTLLHSCPATLEALEQIPAELMEKTEYELVRKPDDVQRRLKISFWNEYRRAQRQKCEMVLTNILFGVASKAYWYNQVCKRSEIFAWVLTPPVEEILVWQELLELGHKKLRRVLKLPLVEKRYWKDKSGEVSVERRTNVALIKEIRAIVEKLQDRLHGTVVQRQEIQSKSLSVHVDGGSKSATEEMEDIKKLIQRLEKAAEGLPELPEPTIDGEIIPDDKEPTDDDVV